MIECIGGGPLDGDMTDVTAGENLYVPVRGIRAGVTSVQDGEATAKPEGLVRQWMHHYVIRRSLEATAWEYAGVVCR